MAHLRSDFVSSYDELSIAVYRWDPADSAPRGVIQIAHGVAEHAARYERLAAALTGAGFRVYSHDHRGHGESTNTEVPHGHFGPGGFEALIGDTIGISEQIVGESPDVPLILLGHSMGSFVAQSIIQDRSDLYSAIVLSGSTSLDEWAKVVASTAEGLTGFNAGFENRTGYEWLSRDPAEVDKYVADPWSGFELDSATMPRMMAIAPRLADPERLAGVRSDLPILVVSGDADPLAARGRLVELLGRRYRAAGVADVTVKLYPEARHELFNETNRDEVTRFVIDWIGQHLP